MIKIGVCDVNEDETCRTVYLLKSQIKFDDIDEKNVTIAMYTFESVILDIEEHKFDCDIFITELSFHNGDNGVKLAKCINDAAPSCNIVFYANKIPNELDIYECRHVNCMLKGRHDARLVMVTSRLIKQINSDDRKAFVKIRYDRNIVILDCCEIMYIKIESRVTKFYTTKNIDKSDEVFYEYRPLSEIMKKLPDNFVRCSSGAIVNMDFVRKYNHQMVTMVDGAEIKVGRKYGMGYRESSWMKSDNKR